MEKSSSAIVVLRLKMPQKFNFFLEKFLIFLQKFKLFPKFEKKIGNIPISQKCRQFYTQFSSTIKMSLEKISVKMGKKSFLWE